MKDTDEIFKSVKSLHEKASSASKVRPLLPLIIQLMKEGVTAKTIVDRLNQSGIDIKVKALYQQLYRWKKREREISMVSETSTSSTKPREGAVERIPTPTSVSSDPLPLGQSISNKGELRKLRDEPIDLDFFSRMSKQSKE